MNVDIDMWVGIRMVVAVLGGGLLSGEQNYRSMSGYIACYVDFLKPPPSLISRSYLLYVILKNLKP